MKNIEYVVTVRDGNFWVMKRTYSGPGLTGGFTGDRHHGPFETRPEAEKAAEQARVREDQTA